MQKPPRPSGGGTWAAFLSITFLVVGLSGMFATYAAPLPLERAISRDGALDRLLAAPDPAKALESADPLLGDSGEALTKGTGDLADRVARERLAVRARFIAESREVGLRLRVMIGVFTVAGALFGVVLLNLARRAPPA